MVQNTFARDLDREQLCHTLGTTLNDTDFVSCLKNLEIKQPSAGQQFWSADEGDAGVWIVLAGKVRLVDSVRTLITTLNPGDSWGESTLFTEADFITYSARASANVRIGYISQRNLKKLDFYHHEVKNCLYRRAVMLNWLLLCPQIAALSKQPGFERAFSLLQKHNLPTGSLPLYLENKRFWLLRRGGFTLQESNLVMAASMRLRLKTVTGRSLARRKYTLLMNLPGTQLANIYRSYPSCLARIRQPI